MRAFGLKEKKQKSLRLSFQQLISRMTHLEQQKEKYQLSLVDQKKEFEKDENNQEKNKIKQDEQIKENNNQFIIEINKKKYDLSKLNNADWIIEKLKHLSKINLDSTSQIVQLRPLCALEFYLLINQLNISDNLHFIKEDICTICQFELFEINDWNNLEELSQKQEIVAGLPCDHYYHYECLKNCINEQHIQCPICSQIYGVKTGDQPDGKMTYTIDHHSHCEGYENVGTIIILYDMFAGKRNGVNFPSTYREAFLPDTPEGRQVFRLLKIAFERKLIFTVGRSVTTGKDNRIVWNGIHHKTSLYGGISCFGYPDPTYFNRVKEELAAKGVY